MNENLIGKFLIRKVIKEKVEFSYDTEPYFKGDRFYFSVEWELNHYKGDGVDKNIVRSIPSKYFDLTKNLRGFNFKDVSHWRKIISKEYEGEKEEIIFFVRYYIDKPIPEHVKRYMDQVRSEQKKEIKKIFSEKERLSQQKKYKKKK